MPPIGGRLERSGRAREAGLARFVAFVGAWVMGFAAGKRARSRAGTASVGRHVFGLWGAGSTGSGNEGSGKRCKSELVTAEAHARSWKGGRTRMQEAGLTVTDSHSLKLGLPVRKQQREGNEGSGLFVVDVQAPAADVYARLQDFDLYLDMIPSIRRSVVRRRSTGADGRSRVTVDLTVSKFNMEMPVVHTMEPDARKILFSLDKRSWRCKLSSLVLNEMHGFWHVADAPNRGEGWCRVWLRANVAVSAAVPRAFVDYIAAKVLRKATDWLRPYMEGRAARGLQQRIAQTPTIRSKPVKTQQKKHDAKVLCVAAI